MGEEVLSTPMTCYRSFDSRSSVASTLPSDVLVYIVDRPFYFAAVETFDRALAGSHTDPKLFSIRLRRVSFTDITGGQALEEAIGDLNRCGARVVFSGANSRVHCRFFAGQGSVSAVLLRYTSERGDHTSVSWPW